MLAVVCESLDAAQIAVGAYVNDANSVHRMTSVEERACTPLPIVSLKLTMRAGLHTDFLGLDSRSF